jgi:alkylated DNA repair dioxygenase AlkB
MAALPSKLLFAPAVDPADVPRLDGLHYRPNYLSSDEAHDLVAQIDAGAWDTSWERRRQLFGAVYGKAVQVHQPLPEWSTQLAQRMETDGLTPFRFDQMLVNEYLSGQGIALHQDYQTYGQTVASEFIITLCDGLSTSGWSIGVAATGATQSLTAQ